MTDQTVRQTITQIIWSQIIYKSSLSETPLKIT